MHALLAAFDLGFLKGLLGALLLPPVPLLGLVLLGGAWLVRGRWARGWACLWLAVSLIWMLATPAVGGWLLASLSPSPPPLAEDDIRQLSRSPRTAVLVLGAGRRKLSLEYGMASLKPLTLERLHYGIWLARRTGLPLGYTGGRPFGLPDEVSEAEVAGRVAAQDFRQPLRWQEDRARDTRENAAFSLPLLRADGITRLVLVTHGFHQRRALRAFQEAAQQAQIPMVFVQAPVGLTPMATYDRLGDWMPSAEGLADTRLALHEWLGWLAGA